MSYTFTTTFETIAEMHEFMTRLLPEVIAPPKQPAVVETPKADSPAPSKQPAVVETPKAEEVDYQTLQKAVFKLANLVTNKGLDAKEHVISIAKKFGFENFKAMSTGGKQHFAAALKAVDAAFDNLNQE